MFRTALRNVLAHKARLLMTVLAVMLGVAFVSGTLVFSNTVDRAFRAQSSKSYDKIAVVVTSAADRDDHAKGGGGLSQRTLDRIRSLDGVDTATGRVSGFAGVADRQGKMIGQHSNQGGNFTPSPDGKDPSYTFTDGSGPVRDDQVALDKGTAATGKYKVGDRVRIAADGPVRTYTLSGVFTTQDDDGVNAGGSLALFTTPAAQRIYLAPNSFHQITVTAKPGVAATKILAEVEPLTAGAKAETGKELAEQRARKTSQDLTGMTLMLFGFAGIALFVGVFLISNTFTMLIAQRTKELALLRAVGASRKQVRRSVLAEALVVGSAASAAGLVVGIGLATGLRALMNSTGAGLPSGPLVITTGTVFLAFVAGTGVTALAAWLPARRAAKVPPVAAMQSVHAALPVKSLVVRNCTGALAMLVGTLSILDGAASGSRGLTSIVGGALLMLIGVIVLIPLLSRPVIALTRPALAQAFGVSGKLAARNAARNPRRTGATASALAIGMTLVMGVTVLGASVGQVLDEMTTANIKADYMVMERASETGLGEEAVTALRKVPGTVAVSPVRASSLTTDDGELPVSAVTPGDIEKLIDIKMVAGSLDGLGAGRIAVSEKTAESRHWKPGSEIAAGYADGTKTNLTVGVVFKDNVRLSPVIASAALFDTHERKPDIREIFVKLDGGVSVAGEKALIDALGRNPAVQIMDKREMKDYFGGLLGQMLGIMYGLLGMVLVIAVLGVVNTLAMSVFERRQEIGMLRAIGLDRRCVKRMMSLEAVVISVFGAATGMALGAFLAWAVGQTFKHSLPGYSTVFPWGEAALFLALAGAVGVLAALWPARTAARLNMLEAIKTE
ncbi:ABC transporter permease [Streptomyces sp. NPDC002537]